MNNRPKCISSEECSLTSVWFDCEMNGVYLMAIAHLINIACIFLQSKLLESNCECESWNEQRMFIMSMYSFDS